MTAIAISLPWQDFTTTRDKHKLVELKILLSQAFDKGRRNAIKLIGGSFLRALAGPVTAKAPVEIDIEKLNSDFIDAICYMFNSRDELLSHILNGLESEQAKIQDRTKQYAQYYQEALEISAQLREHKAALIDNYRTNTKLRKYIDSCLDGASDRAKIIRNNGGSYFFNTDFALDRELPLFENMRALFFGEVDLEKIIGSPSIALAELKRDAQTIFIRRHSYNQETSNTQHKSKEAKKTNNSSTVARAKDGSISLLLHQGPKIQIHHRPKEE